MNLQFRVLRDITSPVFSEVVSMYNELFPANERQPLEVFAERIVSGKTELILAERDRQLQGFALWWNLDQSDFALLDYLAVRKDLHGGGIGSQLLHITAAKAAQYGKDLVIEAERPGEGANWQEREKRIRFYMRQGAFVLKGVRYVLPPLDGSHPTNMVFMAVPQAAKKVYPGKAIMALIRQIYSEVYFMPDNDPLLKSVIADIPEMVEISNAPMAGC